MNRTAPLDDIIESLADQQFWIDVTTAGHMRSLPDAVRHSIAHDEIHGLTDSELLAIQERIAPKARGGLVSVLTSQKPPSSKPRVPFRVKAQAQALMKEVGAFEQDVEARRLSRLRMQVGVGARALLVTNQAPEECLMITLTYKGTNADWEPKHIAAFMDHLRKYLKRDDIKARYLWVAELQKRGVIHYHVALFVPQGLRLPKPDECGWWPHGMTKIEVARAAVPYLLKYLSKDTSKTFGKFPKGARIYGMGGLNHVMRRTRRWLGLPSFVQANSGILDKWTRSVGGGWTDPTGAHFASEFERISVGGAWVLRRVLQHPRAIEAHGPFSWLTDAQRLA